MRKIFLPLCAALALTLCACAPAGEEPSPSPALTTPPPEVSVPVLATPTPVPRESEPVLATPAPSPEPEASAPQAAGYDVPAREYRPWQVGYMEFLTLLQTDNTTWEPGGWGELVGSESYSLYDVDRDGVPELFVKYGDCEAAFVYKCYAFRDGQVVCIGEFAGGHSSLYTHPDKSAVLRSAGHMGYKEVYEYTMENGVLTEEREIFAEEDVRDYTPTEEIVPGAEYIEYFYTWRGEYEHLVSSGRTPYSRGKALLLPIADYYDGPAATGSNSERARRAILAALSGEGEIYGASGDHFYGDTGPVTWTEYIQPGGAYPYNDDPLEVKAHVWQDMNGDGQKECLLWVVKSRGEDSGKPWTSEATVVLSEQGGTVYAYFFGADESIGTGRYDGAGLRDDGTFVSIYGSVQRLSFWKDQCYQYAAPDTSAPAVKWVEAAPAD